MAVQATVRRVRGRFKSRQICRRLYRWLLRFALCRVSWIRCRLQRICSHQFLFPPGILLSLFYRP